MSIERLCGFIEVYDKADRSFNDHLENEKNPESRRKRDSSVRGRKDSREGSSARDYVAKSANERT